MNIYSQISGNKWRTYFIMFFFVVFIATIAYVFANALGYNALIFTGFALILSGFFSLGSFYWSDKLVLATLKAREIKENDNPELFHLIENLTIGAGLPLPKVYVVTDDAPNAFATGRDPQHAVVCVTTGIIPLLNKAEMEGVLAHELSHVKNYDTRLMGIVAVLVGLVAILANIFMQSLWWGGLGSGENDRENGQLEYIFLIIGIVFALLSPVVAALIQLSISRKREYLADASGAYLTRYPAGLANALEKLEKYGKPMKNVSGATAQLFITNPLKGSKHWFSGLFDTHPPIEERIKILRSM